MNIRRWLTAHEARSLLWRSAGVVVAAATGLIAIKIFIARWPDAAPGLVAMVGWLSFLPLLQLGLGRPVYSVLRRRFSQQAPLGGEVRRSLAWFGGLALLAVLVHSALGAWIVARQEPAAPSWSEIALFAAGLAAHSTGAFQRDVAYAISQEDGYERVELLRRLAVLAAYAALGSGLPMTGIGIALLLTGAAGQWATARAARAGFPATGAGPALEGIAPDARRYLLFSLNELLLYNLPLVVFSLQAGAPELIYIGIWTRLFQLVVLPMRMLVDARVNRQTSAYFRRDIGMLRHELKLSLGLAVLAVGLMAVLLAGAMAPLLAWLGAAPLGDDRWLLAGVATWAAGNAVQHVYGSFTLGHGEGFAQALRYSLAALAAVAAVFGAAQWAGLAIGPCLVAMGIAYALSSLAYLRHVRRLLAGTGAAAA